MILTNREGQDRGQSLGNSTEKKKMGDLLNHKFAVTDMCLKN